MAVFKNKGTLVKCSLELETAASGEVFLKDDVCVTVQEQTQQNSDLQEGVVKTLTDDSISAYTRIQCTQRVFNQKIL